MADPKYANLPGIDLTSPDCFETGDLPEADQGVYEPAELGSESVERVTIDTEKAYGRFKGRDLGASRADFSDSVGKGRRTGYDVPRTEYEIVGGGPSVIETPQQKCQRIQHEIRELTEQMSKIQSAVKDDSSSDKMSAVSATKQCEYLDKQLSDLHVEKLLGPQASLDLTDPQGALQKRLLTQLETYNKAVISEKKAVGTPPRPGSGTPPRPGSGTPPRPADGKSVKYELYYKPERAEFSKNAKMANLEERLERLEAVIGQNTEKMGLLTADTANKSLLGSIAVINSKLNLLEPAQLDQVEGRLNAVLQRLNQVTEKKTSTTPDTEKDDKISELYGLVKKWEIMADTLPHLVDRMVGLQDLHEQALQCSQALQYLDTAQKAISTGLDGHSDMLKQLKETFTTNSVLLKSNSENLEKRIKTLQGK